MNASPGSERRWPGSGTRWLVVGAVAGVFAIGLGAYLYTRNSAGKIRNMAATSTALTTSDYQLLEQLARLEQPPVYFQSTARGAQSAKDQPRDSFRKGMEKYGEKKYAEAIIQLEEAVAKDPDHHPAVFYLGICYLITERIDDCVRELAKLAGPESSTYTEESHWYLAKAYLKKKYLSAARQELENVVALNGVYVNEARKSLQLMEGIGKGTK